MTYPISSTESVPLLSASTFSRRFAIVVHESDQRISDHRSPRKTDKILNQLFPMTLKQLEGILKKLAYKSKSKLFTSLTNKKDFVSQVHPVCKIFDCFITVIKKKKMTGELRKSPYWEMWKKNISWIIKRKEDLEALESQVQTVSNEHTFLLTMGGEEFIDFHSEVD